MTTSESPFAAPKGTKENPLSILDLPFTVPKTARYWITYGGGAPVQLPESPKGSVLALETS